MHALFSAMQASPTRDSRPRTWASIALARVEAASSLRQGGSGHRAGQHLTHTTGSLLYPVPAFLKVWWQDAALFVYFSYFYNIHTFIQSNSSVTICWASLHSPLHPPSLVARRLAVRQARVRFSARHYREGLPTELSSDEEMERDPHF